MIEFVVGLIFGSFVGFTMFALITIGKDGHE